MEEGQKWQKMRLGDNDKIQYKNNECREWKKEKQN